MSKLHIQSAGRIREVVDVKVVALYEPSTGSIVHMHTEVAFKGGRIATEKEAIERAHKSATRQGHDTGKLKVKVSLNPSHAMRPHRIDLSSGNFVALPQRPMP